MEHMPALPDLLIAQCQQLFMILLCILHQLTDGKVVKIRVNEPDNGRIDHRNCNHRLECLIIAAFSFAAFSASGFSFPVFSGIFPLHCLPASFPPPYMFSSFLLMLFADASGFQPPPDSSCRYAFSSLSAHHTKHPSRARVSSTR